MLQQLGERSEKTSDEQPWRHQGQLRGEWGEVLLLQNSDSPAALGEDCDEAGCSPSAHVVPWWSRYSLAVCGGPHTREDGCVLKEIVTLWLDQASGRTGGPVERGTHAGAVLLVRLVIPWWTHAGDLCSWRTALHSYIHSRALHYIFPHCLMKVGRDRETLWEPAVHPSATSHFPPNVTVLEEISLIRPLMECQNP